MLDDVHLARSARERGGLQPVTAPKKPADLISRRSLIEIVGNRRAPIAGIAFNIEGPASVTSGPPFYVHCAGGFFAEVGGFTVPLFGVP